MELLNEKKFQEVNSMISSEKKMIEVLGNAGYYYTDINDIFKKKKLESEEVKIMLEWLPEIYKEHIGSGDHLVRSLISAEEPFDPAVLINLFDHSEYNFSIKSGIAYTLSFAKTYDISKWLKNQLSDKEVALERYGLIIGLPNKGGFKSDVELKDFLKQIFDKYPTDEMLGLWKKYGNGKDISFLTEKSNTNNKKLSKSLSKIIEMIKNRE